MRNIDLIKITILLILCIDVANAQSCPLEDLKGTTEYLNAARTIVHDRSYLERNAPCYFEAVEALGNMSNVECIPDLIAALAVRKTKPWENSPNQISKATKLSPYPAALALVKIGHPAIPALLNVVGNNDFASTTSDIARSTLISIALKDANPDPVALFRDAAKKAATLEQMNRYRKAMEEAEGTMQRLNRLRRRE